MTASKLYTPDTGPRTVAAGTTKASPVAGPTVDISAPGKSAVLTASLQNGTAPTAPCTLIAQISGDGTTWRDWIPFAGDLLANSLYLPSIRLPPEAMYGRWIAYGNAGNSVTVTFESIVYSQS